jgi:hypothetical protein
MLKVIDPVRWEAAKAIIASATKDEYWACEKTEDLVNQAIDRGWIEEVPDEPQPPTSQWRPIAEAAGSECALLVGGWQYGDWSQKMGYQIESVRFGYTHYLPLPEPPAREGE